MMFSLESILCLVPLKAWSVAAALLFRNASFLHPSQAYGAKTLGKGPINLYFRRHLD